MKFNEIYTPVFTESESEEEKERLLRADFGSRKMGLVCSKCGHEFSRRVGPNTGNVACPECGCERVKPAVSERAKKKVSKMKESIEDGNIEDAIQKGLSAINDLHGKTDKKSVELMQEALNAIISIERGLAQFSDELTEHLKNGTGRDVLRDISEKLGYNDLFVDGEENE